MKTPSLRFGLVVAALCAMTAIPVRAADFRFPLGLTYESGFQNVVDWYEDAIGAEVDFFLPVGLAFAPYVEFDHGSRIGLDIGPIAFISISEESYYGSDYESSDETFWDVPVALSYGFTFIPRAKVSPFARVGIKQHIADGEAVESTSPGPFAAFGVEFGRQSAVGFGLELGYDGSEIEMVDGQKLKAGEALVSLRVIF